jgi:branched-chain amino acid transport system ATP-binding protein
MLAIGRALMSNPNSCASTNRPRAWHPSSKQEVFKKIAEDRQLGITVLLVEQEVRAVFEMTDRNYVLSSGKIIAQVPVMSCSRTR